MEAIGIIIARGGSKTIPRKNLKPLAGKPLIAYTCATAIAARNLTRVIVTTDCPEIAAVCRAHGVEAPFTRPPELATDSAIGVAPVLHAVQWLEQHEAYLPDYVVVLQPTSPLRAPADIDNALDLLQKTGADAVVGITPIEIHPYWLKELDADGRLINTTPLDKADDNRQNLPPMYYVNGAIYAIRRKALLAGNSLFPPDTRALLLPPERAMDINTAWEWHLVELVIKDKQKHA